MRNRYNTLEEVRADIKKTSRKLNRDVVQLEEEIKVCFLPADSQYVHSSAPYMRYIGYGITAYKTFNVVRKLVGMIKNKRWF